MKPLQFPSQHLRLIAPQTKPFPISQRDAHRAVSRHIIKPPLCRVMNPPTIPESCPNHFRRRDITQCHTFSRKTRPEKPNQFLVGYLNSQRPEQPRRHPHNHHGDRHKMIVDRGDQQSAERQPEKSQHGLCRLSVMIDFHNSKKEIFFQVKEAALCSGLNNRSAEHLLGTDANIPNLLGACPAAGRDAVLRRPRPRTSGRNNASPSRESFKTINPVFINFLSQ